MAAYFYLCLVGKLPPYRADLVSEMRQRPYKRYRAITIGGGGPKTGIDKSTKKRRDSRLTAHPPLLLLRDSPADRGLIGQLPGHAARGMPPSTYCESPRYRDARGIRGSRVFWGVLNVSIRPQALVESVGRKAGDFTTYFSLHFAFYIICHFCAPQSLYKTCPSNPVKGAPVYSRLAGLLPRYPTVNPIY